MPYLDADDYRLWVGNGAGPEVFYEVQGQKGLRYRKSRAKVDQTVKSDDYEAARPGLGSIALSLDLSPKLPDANGYSRLETAHGAKTLVNLQIRKGGDTATADDAVFAIAAYVQEIGPNLDPKADASDSVVFMPTGSPTVDELV